MFQELKCKVCGRIGKKGLVFLRGAAMLTVCSLLMRTVGVGFNVYITGVLGAGGVGLFSLITSAYGFFSTFALSGVNLAASKLCAEGIGHECADEVRGVMKRCLAYSLCFGGCATLLMLALSYPIGVCLIGDAGVGKTAVVESLARRIADGRVPRELENRRIMALEMAAVVAGTKYRGEFEEKLKKILAEAKDDPDVILFIDEIHTVVGAGSAEGSVDAANILKPALARGEIRLIGATTPKEYKRAIERDPALERRFQIVNIREPDEKECERMLLAVRKQFEEHHKLKITDDAVREAIRVSAKYIHDRYLPDKAIDLIDEAASPRISMLSPRKQREYRSAH